MSNLLRLIFEKAQGQTSYSSLAIMISDSGRIQVANAQEREMSTQRTANDERQEDNRQ